MKKKIHIILIALFAITGSVYGQIQGSIIDVGRKITPFEFIDTQDTNNHSDYTGSAPNEVFYRIELGVSMDIIVSHSGSVIQQTSITFCNAAGYSIGYDGGNNPENPYINPLQGYLRMNNLSPGIYYIMSEGTEINGDITTSIKGIVQGQEVFMDGNTPEHPINLGTKSSNFTWSDTKNTSSFANNYQGRLSNDVFYKFTTSTRMNITIAHRISGVNDTYVYVLNSSGICIGKNDDGEGVYGKRAYLEMKGLDAGTYYVVSEGYETNGNITTSIEGTVTSNSQAESYGNYISTITPTIASVSTQGLTTSQSIQNIQYYDGLGRPVQYIQKNTNLISHQEYDAFGRESNNWLPAASAGSNGCIPFTDFTKKTQNTYTNDAKPYSAPIYESSSLNRVIQQYGPGQVWHNNRKAVKTEYLTNLRAGVLTYGGILSCINFEILSSGVRMKEYYPSGQISIIKITDEDGCVSLAFNNKLGQTILERRVDENGVSLSTYYVYDDIGNLRYVFPPMAADIFDTRTTIADTDTDIKQYAYSYNYDDRNRCIAKKLPGADPVYYVYDKADRLIFTQDGEMRLQNKWMFSIPDAMGRVAVTGMCTNALNYTANPLGAVVVKATRSNATDTYKGYTVSGVTISGSAVLSVNYYDNYSFMGKNSIPDITDANFKPETGTGYGTQSSNACNGLLTGTMNAQMNESGITGSFSYSVMYYDDRGRVIQTKANNHLGGVEKEYTGYNFGGQPTKRKLVHSATGKATQTQLYEYLYDHAGRLTQVKHGLNTGTANTVVALNTYDELGRLKTQKKGSLPATTYGYNVRSWTKTIANSALLNQTLYYDEAYGGSVKCYNGNISAMSWKIGSETLQGYAFNYDGVSRLKSAGYLLNGSANTNKTVSNITYDKQGNIKTIQRRGKTTASAYGVIDNLALTYSGNQLTNVTDAGATVTIAESNDFKKGSTATTTYAYNKNGAMAKDLNKNISSISYNLLNLPAQLTLANVAHKYTYSADGQKLKVVQGSSNRDYVGGIIYENGSLKRILIDGGYIEGSTYYYNLNDHLGNTRVVASGTGTIHQRNQYYPFGMPMAETANTEQEKQPYKFGGKEFERKDGLNLYDYSARYMDPALGRFTTMDPMAEKYYAMSPYIFCLNNPLRYTDFNGMQADDTMDGGSLPEVTIVGQKVMEPVRGFWSNLFYLFGGRTYTTPVYGIGNNGNRSSNPIGNLTYNVNNSGYITTIVPKGGIGPTP